PEEALTLIAKAHRLAKEIKPNSSALLWLIAEKYARFGLLAKSVQTFRDSASLARQRAEVNTEQTALNYLLKLSDAGENLPDADALRARLAELKAARGPTE